MTGLNEATGMNDNNKANDDDLQRALDEAQQLMEELGAGPFSSAAVPNHNNTNTVNTNINNNTDDDDMFAIDSDDEDNQPAPAPAAAAVTVTTTMSNAAQDHPLSDGVVMGWPSSATKREPLTASSLPPTTTTTTTPSSSLAAASSFFFSPYANNQAATITTPAGPSTTTTTTTTTSSTLSQLQPPSAASLGDAFRTSTTRFATSFATMAKQAASQVAAVVPPPPPTTTTTSPGGVLPHGYPPTTLSASAQPHAAVPAPVVSSSSPSSPSLLTGTTTTTTTTTTLLPPPPTTAAASVVLPVVEWDNEQKATLIQTHVGDLLPGERVIMFLSNLLHVSDGAFSYSSNSSSSSSGTSPTDATMWCCAMTFYRLIFFRAQANQLQLQQSKQQLSEQSDATTTPRAATPLTPAGWNAACWPTTEPHLLEVPLASLDRVEKTVFVAQVPTTTVTTNLSGVNSLNMNNNGNSFYPNSPFGAAASSFTNPSSTAPTSLMGLLLQTKDGRNLRFTTTSYADTVRAHQALQNYAFPGRRNLGYLFAFESKRHDVMASIVVDPATGQKTVTLPPTVKRFDAVAEFTRQFQQGCTTTTTTTTATTTATTTTTTDATTTSPTQQPLSRHQPWALWTQINQGYQMCASYPHILAGPSSLDERTAEGQRIIRQCAAFRSEGRLPSLTWCSGLDGASLWRASQPKIGLQGNRSAADELFVKHILEQAAAANAINSSNRTADPAGRPPYVSRSMILQLTGCDATSVTNWMVQDTTAAGLKILDLRSRNAAMANRTGGYGYENTSNYPGTTLQFCNIGNIHAVRDSYQKLTALCLSGGSSATSTLTAASSSSTASNASPQDLQWNALVEDTKWLSHIRLILAAAWETAFWIQVHRLPVLLHCSHGWDRTSQVAVLAQLMLDPYYRTRQGFATLVEKDFMSFGHPFHTRCAHGEGRGGATSGSGGNEAVTAMTVMGNAVGVGSVNSNGMDEGQISPIFLQFIDCVFQIVDQYPDCFEFTTQYLLELSDHIYSCRFGNFLCDTERERELVAGIRQRTHSLWDYLEENKEEYWNPHFDGSGILLMPLPSLLRNVKLWSERHCRYSPKPTLRYRTMPRKPLRDAATLPAATGSTEENPISTPAPDDSASG